MASELYSFRTQHEIIEKLNQIAEAMDRSRNWVINQALSSYIEDQRWYEEQVAQSRSELARGEGVAHDEVMEELQEMIDKFKE